MIDDPRMGTLVVASAGRIPKLSRSSASAIGPARVWRSCGPEAAHKAGLPQLKHARIPIFDTPEKLARGLASRLAYHTWREHRLADGFATAPSRTAPQDEAIAQALALGRSETPAVREQRAVGRLGGGERARAPAVPPRPRSPPQKSSGFRWLRKIDSPNIPHKTEAGVVGLNV